MRKIRISVIGGILAAAVFLFAACSGEEKDVSSLDQVKPSGNSYRLTQLSCDDAATEEKYRAVLNECVYEFTDETNGVWRHPDDAYTVSFTYTKVRWAGGGFGVSISFGEHGSFYFIDDVLVPGSLTYTTMGNFTYTATDGGHEVSITFGKI